MVDEDQKRNAERRTGNRANDPAGDRADDLAGEEVIQVLESQPNYRYHLQPHIEPSLI